jgi:DNA-binding transcriptional MerR regulator
MSPRNPTDARYTLTELAALAGTTPRTVRYYLSQGLLPSVGVAGPGVKYDDTHLARLRLIRRLQTEHQPLAEIRRRLDSLEDDAILAIATEPGPATPADSALDYIRRVTGSPTTREAAPLYAMSPGRPRRSMDDTATPEPEAAAAPTPPESTVERSQWERIVLGPDVELHIRRPLSRQASKRVERLIEFARDTLTEEPS